ncbi:putative nucleotide-diphospho-sugar transferase [Frigidibacter sp.]|uniref:putative nucleotide-diphospho-sugar transferase n=1 Tax=Frigidibacter sp. TaxID=2586418 RepID=UPI0027376F3E|nr:putative nucleotide-diphospho-sugar transferase [Frigidibacter sp.]MDP3341517.1 putative nucleotide-diphospho-sugar transferase [Frigidibacter sp.]
MTDPTSEPRDGFVFAATGQAFIQLAAEAARSLRATNPGVPIDLFTDGEVTDPVFDRVHQLGRSWFRPKFEALRRSRFQRTICLDADVIVVADMRDVFEVLGRFDFVAAHEQRRNTASAMRQLTRPMPAAFPQINGGMIGIRQSPETQAFIDLVERTMIEGNHGRDQYVLRELLFDSDLRIWVLPPEYNLMAVRQVEVQGTKFTAPRVLHLPRLHGHMKGRTKRLESPAAVIGPALWRHIQRMIAADMTLGGTGAPLARPVDRGLFGSLRAISANVALGLSRLLRR